MKKTFILASLIAFTSMTTAFANDGVEPIAAPQPPAIEKQKTEFGQHRPTRKPDMHKKKFEQRLKLTDEQKAQAKEIHQKGFEEMKPIMEQIKSKKQEARAVKLSRIAVEEQEVRLAKIGEELKVLHKQAHELRMKNMKEFEKILTKKQKRELAKIKKEGRKKFAKNHNRPPMGHPGFRPDFKPGFSNGPALPPPEPSVEK